jgi:hypothetical protein
VANTTWVRYPPLTKTRRQHSAVSLLLQATTSRQEFLSAAVASTVGSIGLGVAAFVATPSAASAAKYGSFGAGSPEVLSPSDVDIDAEILRSGPVQSALSKIKSYRDVVVNLQSALERDGQTNLRSTIIKELDLSVLRTSLNTVNSAIDEDSQRGTDRLIRVILQDITEIEIANTQKDGVPRSPRRLEILQSKLSKLDQAFTDYLAFFA